MRVSLPSLFFPLPIPKIFYLIHTPDFSPLHPTLSPFLPRLTEPSLAPLLSLSEPNFPMDLLVVDILACMLR